jgi:hypothetical protein
MCMSIAIQVMRSIDDTQPIQMFAAVSKKLIDRENMLTYQQLTRSITI